ncbi:hypothetical protein AB0J82_30080 [Asanoa sp. NPDC049518]|uniref:hypothetical protein n=1 Tax=unclassified Asanoa TaxID=2685164 RepID=UPI0034378B31
MTRSGKQTLWVLGIHAGVAAVCLAGAFAQSDHQPDNGGSFSVSARDLALWILGYFGLPILLLSIVTSLAVVTFAERRRERREAG